MEQIMLEAVDIEELLTKIADKVVRKNKDYLQIDIETLKKAAKGDKPAYFLWLAHQEGTWCLNEREVFLKGTAANYIWLSFKRKNKAIETVSIIIKSLENDRIIGDICTIDHYEHCKEIKSESHQALTAEIHYDESVDNRKICIPMKNYIINDYWNQAVTNIGYTAENEHKLMQSITCIRKRQQQNASKSNMNDYLNHLEEKLFINYLWTYDKSKTAEQNENMKRKKYNDLKQAGYIFINLKEASAANRLSMPVSIINEHGEMKSVNRVRLCEYWNSGGYLCMAESWKKMLTFMQINEELPYSKNQLQLIAKSARVSYDEASEAAKEILGAIIAKTTFLLNISRNAQDIFAQEAGLMNEVTDKKALNTNIVNIKESSSIDESIFSKKEKQAVYQLLTSSDSKYTDKVAESTSIRL